MSGTRKKISLILIFFLAACAAPPPVEKEVLRPEITASQKEREVEAFARLNEILQVSRSGRERNAVLAEKEKLYLKLIKDYPDVPIAQESYWKLIEMNLEDKTPLEYDRADALFNEFYEAYPESGMKGPVYRTFIINYTRNNEWKRLAGICEPEYMEYLEKGTSLYPLTIFMYAEANFKLGNYDEAEKAFRIIIEKFPYLKENGLSKARITYIERNK